MAFIDILNDVVIAWNFDNMNENEKTVALISDATKIEDALIVASRTSFQNYMQGSDFTLDTALSTLSKELKKVASGELDIPEETLKEDSTKLMKMLLALKATRNDKWKDEEVNSFVKYVYDNHYNN